MSVGASGKNDTHARALTLRVRADLTPINAVGRL